MQPVGQLFRRLPPVPLFGLASRKERGVSGDLTVPTGMLAKADAEDAEEPRPDYKRPPRTPSRVNEVIGTLALRLLPLRSLC